MLNLDLETLIQFSFFVTLGKPSMSIGVAIKWFLNVLEPLMLKLPILYIE
jgi:hypothetical protein